MATKVNIVDVSNRILHEYAKKKRLKGCPEDRLPSKIPSDIAGCIISVMTSELNKINERIDKLEKK